MQYIYIKSTVWYNIEKEGDNNETIFRNRPDNKQEKRTNKW